MKKERQIIDLIFNLGIVSLEVIATFLSFKRNGFRLLKFYTEDSNLFALVVCFIFSVYLIKSLINKKDSIPHWVNILKYLATCFLTITFMVVIFILIPLMSREHPKIAMALLVKDSMLYQHLICPLLVFISFMFIENNKISQKDTLLSLIPTIVYAIVLITLNVLRITTGPYPFLRVYNQPIYQSILWCILILTLSYIIGWLIRKIKNK